MVRSFSGPRCPFCNKWGSMNAGAQGINQTGASMIEFVLILPLLLFLAIVTIDFCFALTSSLSLTNAVRDGSRAASLIAMPDEQTLPVVEGTLLDIVQNRLGNYALADRVEILSFNLSYPTPALTCGQMVRLDVSSRYNAYLLDSIGLGGFLNFNESLTARLLQQDLCT